MKWAALILEVLLRALLPALIEASRDSAEDARGQPGLKRSLRRRVRETWGRAAVLLVLALVLSGCGIRTVYVALCKALHNATYAESDIMESRWRKPHKDTEMRLK